MSKTVHVFYDVTVFAPTGVEVVVPLTSILCFSLELKKIEALPTAHIPHCCRKVAVI